jgi:hypothetical protein
VRVVDADVVVLTALQPTATQPLSNQSCSARMDEQWCAHIVVETGVPQPRLSSPNYPPRMHSLAQAYGMRTWRTIGFSTKGLWMILSPLCT